MGVVRTFLLSSKFSPLSPSLWETARYRLKYCLKGPWNQNTTNKFKIAALVSPDLETVAKKKSFTTGFAVRSADWDGSGIHSTHFVRGWPGGAMVMCKLQVPGSPTIWIRVGQGLTALEVGADGVVWSFFSLVYHFSFLSSSLWGMARYRLKYCLKGPLSPRQPTNHLVN